MSDKRGEVRLSEILKHLGALTEGGTGEPRNWQESGSAPCSKSLGPGVAGHEEPFWPEGVESPGASFGEGGRQLPCGNDPQLRDAIAKVVLYLQVQRDIYYPAGHPLAKSARAK